MNMLDRPAVVEAQHTPASPVRRNWLGLAVVVLALAGAAFGVVKWRAATPPPSPSAAPPAPALTVSVAPVIARRMAASVVGDGSVIAWQELVIGAEVGGLRLVEAPLDEGMAVRAGQVMARLDDNVLAAQAAQAEAAIGEAQAFLELARAEQARAEELVRSQSGSRQLVDQRQSATRQAEARLIVLRARRDEALARLAQTRILAPSDGIVSRVALRIGAVTALGQEMFRVIRDGRLELEARVPELELASVTPGQRAVIRHGGQMIVGEVRLIMPVVTPETRLGVVRIVLPADSGLRPGMFARADIQGPAREVVMVPASAVVFREGAPQAFVLPEGSERVVMRRLTAGTRMDGMVEIIEGLVLGERVVTAGAGFLVQGDLVRLAP